MNTSNLTTCALCGLPFQPGETRTLHPDHTTTHETTQPDSMQRCTRELARQRDRALRLLVAEPSQLGRFVLAPPGIPEDVAAILTQIARYAHENPTSAERRRIGAWLGIAPHMLPRTGT